MSYRDLFATKFQLLHLGLVREYLDLEFRCELPFGYNLERVIDDFVLMCIFVGNDFLPGLPGLDIAENAIDNMFKLYREILPQLGKFSSLDLRSISTLHRIN